MTDLFQRAPINLDDSGVDLDPENFKDLANNFKLREDPLAAEPKPTVK